MAYSHIGLATGDLEATHRFYTEAMAFSLVHVEAANTEIPGGWLRHALYDTGDGTLVAFQELHDERCEDVDFAISRGLGLPAWVNHLAFRADTPAELDAACDRWLRFGCDVVKMRHSQGSSVYTEDPNGNVVEWSYLAQPFSEDQQEQALARLRDPDLPRDAPTDLEFFLAADYADRNA